jgi:hypothetical protein
VIAPAPPASAPPAPSGLSVAAGAGAAAGVGLAPGVVALGRVFGSLAWSHVALELGGEATVPSTSAIRRADGAGFSHRLLLASLAGCGVTSHVSGCVLGKIGQIRVAGDGVDLPATSSGVIVQSGLRLAVAQTLGRRVLVVAHADGIAFLTRAVVTLDGMPVWTTPRIAATFGVDVGVRFR